MTLPQKEREAAENLLADVRLGLKGKYERFLAEGGAGRSNTNALLKYIVEEIEALKETASKRSR
ncbi:MAG: hypothetical protein ACREAZ_07055 [Nitrososphaera sp.]